ncbi:MAG TPA: acyl-CoA dehydrogenase family protein [Hyphomicrobiales bacterium]
MSDTVPAPAKQPVSFADLDYDTAIARAEAMVPVLRLRAEETEALRNLPESTERELHESGLFRIVQPKRVGGAELDFVALLDVTDILARGDASVAWNYANLACHHWQVGLFEPEVQDEIWGENPDALIASGFVFPAGKARKVEGGYMLKGRWPFSSGVTPSTWNLLCGMVADDAGGPPEHRMFMVPATDYRIIDTWDALGLKGTGSHDVQMDETFVPAHRSISAYSVNGGPSPGSKVNPGSLYKVPVFATLPYLLSGIALGNAQACVDDYIEATRSRVGTFNSTALAGLQSIQIKIAQASANIDAARLIMRSTCIKTQADAAAGRVPDLLEKNRYRRDGAFAVNLCTEAVQTLFNISGARGLYMSGAVQRQMRDALGVAAHISFSFDAAGANYGRVALDLPNENPLL